ncbi:MAG: cytochrome-c oxidase, cbb3-type subunit III [Steroidobacteraceae bacterium]
MSQTASFLITLVTFANIAGALWLLWWMRRRRGGEAQAGSETTGHVWDGDLTESNNPLPRWWLGMFIISVVFSLAYLALYPGLGNFAGTLGWSQAGQLQRETAANAKLIAATFTPFENRDVVDLSRDPAALRVAQNLFINNCATCHGSDGRGAPGFPNLTDNDWLWGGTPQDIVNSIANGRQGVMASWEAVLGPVDVENVVAYVLSLSGRSTPVGDVAAGKARFDQICVACHGADGRGNQLLGAPNLTDGIWLNGGAIDTIRTTIAKGRIGEMPAHLDRLGQLRVNLLAAYVMSLGNGQAAEPK